MGELFYSQGQQFENFEKRGTLRSLFAAYNATINATLEASYQISSPNTK